MNILDIMLVIITVGIILYCVNSFIPMQGTVLKILNITVILVLIVWLLRVFGVWQRFSHWRV